MTTLVQYEQARAALAKAGRVDQVLAVRDEIEHVKLYAKQIQDQALLADASAFQMRVERRLGEVLIAAKEAGQIREGRPKKNGSASEPFPTVTLAEVGVDKKLSARAQKRATISEQAFENAVDAMRERVASGRAKIIEGEIINGARSIMGSRQEPDDSLDYFPTPPWATRALMEVVLPGIGIRAVASAWEPAAGEGHLAEVLREYCPDVRATDIFDYGCGDDLLDFLSLQPPVPGEIGAARDWIITNPPFGDKAVPFVLKSLERAGAGVAMFVRSQWAFEGIERYVSLFRDLPPAFTCPFVERVPLCKGRWEPEGATATAYAWLVWRYVEGDGWRGGDMMFRIPPGCCERFTRTDDAERFTTHPVTKKDHELIDITTGEIVSPLATGLMTALKEEQIPLSRDSEIEIPDLPPGLLRNADNSMPGAKP